MPRGPADSTRGGELRAGRVTQLKHRIVTETKLDAVEWLAGLSASVFKSPVPTARCTILLHTHYTSHHTSRNIVDTGLAKKKGLADSGPAQYDTKEESLRKAVKTSARPTDDPDVDGSVKLANANGPIVTVAPGIDTKTLRYQNLSTLVAKSGRFEVHKQPCKPLFIRRKPTVRNMAAWASGSA